MGSGAEIDLGSRLLARSPYGETEHVFQSLCRLNSGLDGENLRGAWIERCKMDFEDVVVDAGGYGVLLTGFNHVESNVFVCPFSKQRFVYDPMTRDVRVVGIDLRDSFDECDVLRMDVQRRMVEYVSRYYPFGIVNVFLVDGSVHICIVSKRYTRSGCWSGKWRSTWTYKPGSNTMTGEILVETRYFEEGSMFMSASKNISVEMDEESVEWIVNRIGKEEEMYQEELNQICDQKVGGMFKSLRRMLPVMKTKMNWEAIVERAAVLTRK